MTLAGLEWLSERGISRANLFVESDNIAALRTYDRLGFELHSINRAFTTGSAEGTSVKLDCSRKTLREFATSAMNILSITRTPRATRLDGTRNWVVVT